MNDNNLFFNSKNQDELKKMLKADIYDDATKFESKYFKNTSENKTVQKDVDTNFNDI